MVRILRISTSHPLYPASCALRDDVLLRPIGLTFEAFTEGWPHVDAAAEHFVAVADHTAGARVVGTALLIAHYDQPGVGKLMQMAVEPQRQHEGVGRRIVIALEARAFGELALTELFCHARDDAMPFYAKLGWQVVGEGFTEVGVPHHRMRITAEPPPPESDIPT